MKTLIVLLACVQLLLPLKSAAANLVEQNPLEKSYQGEVDLQDMVLPLPEGQWKVVGRGFEDEYKFFTLILEKDIEKRPQVIIIIRKSTLKNASKGYKSSDKLKRTDLLYVNAIKNAPSASSGVDGWLIDHRRLSFEGEKRQAVQELEKYVIDNKLIIPGNFIVTEHILTGAAKAAYGGGASPKYLNYKINVNPEAYGFAPPANAEWSLSDWNILKINSDPKKVVFIEKLKDEGGVFHKRLQEAFGE